MLYPIRITDLETGNAVRATSLTEARKKLRQYIREKQGEYYLGNPIPYATNEQKYVLVIEGAVAKGDASSEVHLHHASTAALRRQEAVRRRYESD